MDGSDHQDAPNVGRVPPHLAQARDQTDVKKPSYYFPESYSSGYWSFNEGSISSNVYTDPLIKIIALLLLSRHALTDFRQRVPCTIKILISGLKQ